MTLQDCSSLSRDCVLAMTESALEGARLHVPKNIAVGLIASWICVSGVQPTVTEVEDILHTASLIRWQYGAIEFAAQGFAAIAPSTCMPPLDKRVTTVSLETRFVLIQPTSSEKESLAMRLEKAQVA